MHRTTHTHTRTAKWRRRIYIHNVIDIDTHRFTIHSNKKTVCTVPNSCRCCWSWARWARRHIEDITDVNRIRFRVRLWSVFFFFVIFSVTADKRSAHSPSLSLTLQYSFRSSYIQRRPSVAIVVFFLHSFLFFCVSSFALFRLIFFIHRRRCSCCLLPVRMYGRTCRHTFSWTIEARAHKKSKRAERACGIMSSAKNIMTARDAMVV